jgi:Domain of unknown function (DUF4091)/FG-GAP-like repeat
MSEQISVAGQKPLRLSKTVEHREAVPGPTGSSIDVFDSMTLILPTNAKNVPASAGADSISLVAARNEFESAQIRIKAAATPLANVSVELGGPLSGPGGQQIPAGNLRFYREEYYTLLRMSDKELDAEFSRSAEPAGICTSIDCRIPDALIPDVDLIYGNKRAAFPFPVPANENRVVWLDVLVPPTAVPGTYTQSVLIKQGATVISTLPISVRVLNVTLPSNPSMFFQVIANVKNFAPTPPGQNFNASQWDAFRPLAAFGANNRVSVIPEGGVASMIQPVLNSQFGGTLVGTQMAGTHPLRFPISNAPDFGLWKSVVDAAGGAATKRFFCDEIHPTEIQYPPDDILHERPIAPCSARYSAAASVQPGIRLQSIPFAQTASNLLPQVGEAVPQVVNLAPGTLDLGKLPQMKAWRADGVGRELMAYTSCVSGGCNQPYGADQNNQFVGIPSYGIDQPTSQHRAMGWHGFVHSLTGEHYWESTIAYGTAWDDCMLSGVNVTGCQYANSSDAGMNGDGTFFYPYDQAKVGGDVTRPVSVESLRLRRIRDGREDNDLLKAVAGKSAAFGASAMTLAQTAFPEFNQSNKTSAEFATIRAQLNTLVDNAFPSVATNRSPNDIDCDGDDDLVATTPGGAILLFKRQAGDWDPASPVTIANGQLNGTAQYWLADMNGDAKPDLAVRSSAGAISFFPGDCTGTFLFGIPVALAATAQNHVPVGDVDGDGRFDLLDQRSDGSLWLARGIAAGFAAPVAFGTGTGGSTLTGAGDFSGDGRSDLIERQASGAVVVRNSNYPTGWSPPIVTGITIQSANVPRFVRVGDANADGRGDLVVIDSTGAMRAYFGQIGGGFSVASTQIGSGWSTTIADVSSATSTFPDAALPNGVPQFVGAFDLTSTSVTVRWTDNATNERGYQLYRIEGGVSTLVPGCPLVTAGLTQCVDTGLTPGSYPAYYLYAWNDAGSVPVPSYLLTRPPTALPLAASVGGAVPTGPSSVTLTWTDNSSNESGFRIRQYINGAWTQITSAAPNATSIAMTGGSLDTTQNLFFAVVAYNASGEVWPEDVVISFSKSSSSGALSAPLVTSVSTSGTSATVNWNDTSTDELGFQVFRVNGGTSTRVPTCSYTTPGLATCTDQGLTPGISYQYYVFSWGAGGSIGYSGQIGYAGVARPLAAPYLASATGTTQNSIRIQWIDNSVDEESFVVSEWSAGALVDVASVAPNTTSSTIAGLAPGSSHVYVISARRTGKTVYAPSALWATTVS